MCVVAESREAAVVNEVRKITEARIRRALKIVEVFLLKPMLDTIHM